MGHIVLSEKVGSHDSFEQSRAVHQTGIALFAYLECGNSIAKQHFNTIVTVSLQIKKLEDR